MGKRLLRNVTRKKSADFLPPLATNQIDGKEVITSFCKIAFDVVTVGPMDVRHAVFIELERPVDSSADEFGECAKLWALVHVPLESLKMRPHADQPTVQITNGEDELRSGILDIKLRVVWSDSDVCDGLESFEHRESKTARSQFAKGNGVMRVMDRLVSKLPE
jgi:hypothetical protein